MEIKKKKSNNSGMFATLSIFAIGAYYTTDPSLIGLGEGPTDPRLAHNEKLNKKGKKPKSLIENIGSSFIASNQNVTFDRWARTPEAVEAYEKWRKSPTGVNALIEDFKASSYFGRYLEKWASRTKRDIGDFRKIALKNDKYKTLFHSWKATNSGALFLKDQFITSDGFDNKKDSWINSPDAVNDLANYLSSETSKKDYQDWYKDAANKPGVETSWKKTGNYITKKDAWLAIKNAKDDKAIWLNSDKSQTFYNAWKKGSTYRDDLISNWKKTANYRSARDQWIIINSIKRPIEEYKKEESFWSAQYQTYKNSPAGNLEIENAIKQKSEYLTAKNTWSPTGKNTWLSSDASTPSYNTWRVTANARNNFKPNFEASSGFDTLKEDWIDNNYNPKSKANWINDGDATPSYNLWKATNPGQRALQTTWKGTQDYINSKDAWVALQPGTRSKDDWSTSQVGLGSYNTWKAIAANETTLKTHWQSQADFATAKSNWLTKTYNSLTTSAWADSSDANSYYNTWRTTSGARNLLKGNWEASGDFTSAKSNWATTNFNNSNHTKTIWSQDQDFTNKYNTWKAVSANEDGMKTDWKTTNNYTSAKDNWINNWSITNDKNHWSSTLDSSSAYITWKAVDANETTLKNHWQTQADFATAKSSWLTKTFASLTTSAWADSNDSTSYYNTWRTTSGARNLLKSNWEASADFTSAKSNWATTDFDNTNHTKTIWSQDPDFTSKYNTWKADNASEQTMKTAWIATPNYTQAKDYWINNEWVQTKGEWSKSTASLNSYNIWKAIAQNDIELKSDWKATQNYTTKKTNWINTWAQTNTKDEWAKIAAGRTDFDTWKVVPANDTSLQTQWQSNPDFTSKKNAWINGDWQTASAKDEWKKTAGKVAFDSWKDQASNIEKIKNQWLTTDNYTKALEKWTATNFTPTPKDQWLQSPNDGFTKAQAWGQTDFKTKATDFWLTTDSSTPGIKSGYDYQSGKEWWRTKRTTGYQSITEQNWKRSDHYTNSYNAFKRNNYSLYWKLTGTNDETAKRKSYDSSSQHWNRAWTWINKNHHSTRGFWNDALKMWVENTYNDNKFKESSTAWKDGSVGSTFLQNEWVAAGSPGTYDQWIDEDTTMDFQLKKIFDFSPQKSHTFNVKRYQKFYLQDKALWNLGLEDWFKGEGWSSFAAVGTWYKSQDYKNGFISYIDVIEPNHDTYQTHANKTTDYNTWVTEREDHYFQTERGQEFHTYTIDKYYFNNRLNRWYNDAVTPSKKQDTVALVYGNHDDSDTDYLAWQKTEAEPAYKASPEFSVDQNTYRDKTESGNTYTNGQILFFSLPDSDSDYNAWKADTNARYLESNQYQLDFTSYRDTVQSGETLSEGHKYYQTTSDSATKYSSWKNQEGETQYLASSDFSTDFETYRDEIESGETLSNGHKFYLTKPISDTDFNTWKASSGEVSYQASNKFTTDFETYRDTKETGQTLTNGQKVYFADGDSDNDYNTWKDQKIDTAFKADSTNYNAGLDNWTSTKTNGVGVYKTQAQATTDFNTWKTSQADASYITSDDAQNDFETYRDKIETGQTKSNGYLFYLNDDDSTTDYNSWKDTTGESSYLADQDFQSDFETYRDTTESGESLTNGAKAYFADGDSDTDYSTWKDQKIDTAFKADTTNYNAGLDNWTSTKANGIGVYKTQAKATTDFNTWKTLQADASYTTSDDAQSDFETYRDKIETGQTLSIGHLFYLNQGDSDTDFTNQKTTKGDNDYPTSAQFTTDFNEWESFANGKDTYGGVAKSDQDYQQWIYQTGENPYKNSGQYITDLDAWSTTKTNGLDFFKASRQSETDWLKILDSEFAKTQKHTDKIAELKLSYDKEIYQNSNQFITDYNAWDDPKKRSEDKYLLDEDNAFSLDLNNYYDTASKKIAAYADSTQSDTDYGLYTNDLKTENDYLTSPEKTVDMDEWATFDNAKDLFKTSPFVVTKTTRSKDTYINSNQFLTDAKAFLATTDLQYFDLFLTGEQLKNFYEGWKDPVGVERDPEAYIATRDFVEKINNWSSNIINGMSPFERSTLAQTLFQKYINK